MLAVSAGRDNKGTQFKPSSRYSAPLEPRSAGWVQDTRASALLETSSLLEENRSKDRSKPPDA
jgi:hypothetical protein